MQVTEADHDQAGIGASVRVIGNWLGLQTSKTDDKQGNASGEILGRNLYARQVLCFVYCFWILFAFFGPICADS